MDLDLCLCKFREHHLSQIIFTRDGTNKTLFTGGWESFTGLSKEELEKNWLLPVHPDDMDECEIRWKNAKKIHQQFDLRVRRYDGEYRWFLADLDPIEDPSGISATFVDITDRQNEGFAKIDRANLIEKIVNSIHVLVSYVDAKTCRYKYVNQSFAEFFNIPRKDVLGKTISNIFGSNFPQIKDHIDRAIQGHIQRYEINVCVNGIDYKLSTSIVPEMEDGGSVKGIFILSEPMIDEVINDHFHDIESTIQHWQDDPVGYCNFVGRTFARIGYRNLFDLNFAIGVSYFAFKEIADRIDFLYDHHGEKLGGQKGSIISDMVNVKLQSEIICLHDKGGKHNLVKAMLIRDVADGKSYFSIRYYVELGDRAVGYLVQHWDTKNRGRPTFRKVASKISDPDDDSKYEQSYEFWNFREQEEEFEGVIAHPESQGFYDLTETKSIADLIILASNGVGFIG